MVRTTKESIQAGIEMFHFYTASIPIVRLPTYLYLSNETFTEEKRREREHDHQVVTKFGMLEAISVPPSVFMTWCLMERSGIFFILLCCCRIVASGLLRVHK
jgi:hypothetical protein